MTYDPDANHVFLDSAEARRFVGGAKEWFMANRPASPYATITLRAAGRPRELYLLADLVPLRAQRLQYEGCFPPERIRAIRKALGLTQEQFAEKLDVTRTSLVYWETGRSRPRDAPARQALAAAEAEARQ